MIGRLEGALKPEHFATRSASYTLFMDDNVILAPAQELKINYIIH
jgi:hypothetical protein